MLKRCIFVFFVIIFSLFATDIVNELSGDVVGINASSELTSEKIEKISRSKRIFVITNANNSFLKGDFISLVLNDQLVARALVAKEQNSIAGIKIVKIYSLANWTQLTPGTEIQIIRGDDSYFKKKQEKREGGQDEFVSQLSDDDDLFSETSLHSEDELEFEENSKRVVKNDNILSFNMGLLPSTNQEGESVSDFHMMMLWAYQLDDNIWAEFGYGLSVAENYPADGMDTQLNNITFRAKYTIQAPFYSIIQPYIGYQIIGASEQGSLTTEQQEAVELLKKNNVIFGATILKRIVPGWFIRADVGTDVVTAGLSLEF